MTLPDNNTKYWQERSYRWEKAAAEELEAATKIAKHIQSVTKQQVNVIRFDERVFSTHPPKQFEWAKGAPDFALELRTDNGSHYLFLEIKLKSVKYRKTTTGGTTQRGSVITRYNCPSYYLDVEPVYRNMSDFTKLVNLRKDSFILAFVDGNDIDLISLEQIKYLLTNGSSYTEAGVTHPYNLCVYGEGYGRVTYLIPQDKTLKLQSLSKTDWLNAFSLQTNIPSPTV